MKIDFPNVLAQNTSFLIKGDAMRLIKILKFHVFLIIIFMGRDVYAGTIPQSLMDSVVSIYSGAASPETGKYSPLATGFIVKKTNKRPAPGQKSSQLYVVTNKHVIEKTSVTIRFNDKLGITIQSINIPFEKWVEHPTGNMDVVVARIEEQALKEVRYGYFDIEKDSLDITRMVEKGIAAGDFVYVVGYPIGLIGAYNAASEENQKKFPNQYPIVRSGSIARIQDLFDLMFGTFFIDTFIFPGNSGSPVILRPDGAHIKGTKPTEKPFLIGIVPGYFPNQIKNSNLQENTGLTHVIPIDYVLQTIEAADNRK